MAIRKTEINQGGVEVNYWRVAQIRNYDPDAKNAIIVVKGYTSEDARRDQSNGDQYFKTHEFLVANTEKTVQHTRPATVAEKKEILPSLMLESKTDAEIEEIACDVVESEEVVKQSRFDEFQALYEKGKWQEAAYNFLKSETFLHNDFFITEAEDA